ncbi:transposase [Pseudomonas chlororaphis]
MFQINRMLRVCDDFVADRRLRQRLQKNKAIKRANNNKEAHKRDHDQQGFCSDFQP